jgi:hypothetical protein
MHAVNGFETAEVAQKFRKDMKLTIPFVLGGSGDKGVSKVYGVVAYPTTYILDKDGVVKAQIVGGDTATMRKVLADLGVK